jgi:hypothetical protein
VKLSESASVLQVTPYEDPTGESLPGAAYAFSVTAAADGWVYVTIADRAATDTNGNPSLPSETLAVQVRVSGF